ncbi:hypothetical protein BDZ89DRAFT_712680 [Hymenopellis radicata]|nr:hypothetical protein BDZ89DRAFT_712680 [Hymenopellis radicata]
MRNRRLFTGFLCGWTTLNDFRPMAKLFCWKIPCSEAVSRVQSELMLYTPNGICVYFPTTMHRASFEEDNISTPAILKGPTAKLRTKLMWRGPERGDAHIAGDFVTNMIRASGAKEKFSSSWTRFWIGGPSCLYP